MSRAMSRCKHWQNAAVTQVWSVLRHTHPQLELHSCAHPGCNACYLANRRGSFSREISYEQLRLLGMVACCTGQQAETEGAVDDLQAACATRPADAAYDAAALRLQAAISTMLSKAPQLAYVIVGLPASHVLLPALQAQAASEAVPGTGGRTPAVANSGPGTPYPANSTAASVSGTPGAGESGHIPSGHLAYSAAIQVLLKGVSAHMTSLETQLSEAQAAPALAPPPASVAPAGRGAASVTAAAATQLASLQRAVRELQGEAVGLQLQLKESEVQGVMSGKRLRESESARESLQAQLTKLQQERAAATHASHAQKGAPAVAAGAGGSSGTMRAAGKGGRSATGGKVSAGVGGFVLAAAGRRKLSGKAGGKEGGDAETPISTSAPASYSDSESDRKPSSDSEPSNTSDSEGEGGMLTGGQGPPGAMSKA